MTEKKGKNPLGGPAAVADLIKGLDPDHQKRLLENVAKRDPALVAQVREMLFTWDEIVILDDLILQRLLRETPRTTLIVALRGAAEPILTKISKNLSSRAWAALQDEIEAIGPQKKNDVDQARTLICNRVQVLTQ
jgi:flagellar motor switch protein FliG